MFILLIYGKYLRDDKFQIADDGIENVFGDILYFRNAENHCFKISCFFLHASIVALAGKKREKAKVLCCVQVGYEREEKEMVLGKVVSEKSLLSRRKIIAEDRQQTTS